MAYDGRYDTPQFIDAFLVRLKLADEELAAEDNNRNGGETGVTNPDNEVKNDVVDSAPGSAPGSVPHSGLHTPAIVSAASSPPSGTFAPPSTPERPVLRVVNVDHLPSIDEDNDQDEDHNCFNVAMRQDQDQASTQPFRPTAPAFQPSVPFPRAPNEPVATGYYAAEITAQLNAANAYGNGAHFTGYDQDEDDYVPAARIRGRGLQQTIEESREMALKEEAEYHMRQVRQIRAAIERDEAVHNAAAIDAQRNAATMGFGPSGAAATFNNGHFVNSQIESTAIYSSSDDDDGSSVVIIVDAAKTPDSHKSNKSVDDDPTQNLNDDVTRVATDETSQELQKQTTCSSDLTIKSSSREHATYFANWDTANERSTAPSRVRLIKLENLPSTADFTLIQSLIHGGAIEEMNISTSSNGSTSAYIYFTSADACDAYYERYPNGLEFKVSGKKHVAYVDKGQEVNVVSSILASYLDCGASRVVKVTGADEDWSMKALYKVAEGRNARRKVEAIVDSYRNESRSITFRFTRIADAVAFRGELLRDSEWADTEVTFGVDPCEKADGVH